MRYSIIGAGNVGAALARQFARSGIAVGIANTRGPASIAAIAKELGDRVVPLNLRDALEADVIILAVPFRAHAAIAAALPDWGGKLLIDAMNTYGIQPAELGGRASTQVVASAFVGAQVAKTLNQLPAKLLAQDPAVSGGRRVMFVAGDDARAETAAAQLVADLGFAPILLGKLEEGGQLIRFGGSGGGTLALQNLIKLG
jgi:predicted dinucleotide-binding enzyme